MHVANRDIEFAASQLERRMRLRRGHEVVGLGDVELLRAGPEPGADAAHRHGSLDPVEPDQIGIEAAGRVDAADRRENLNVVELQVK